MMRSTLLAHFANRNDSKRVNSTIMNSNFSEVLAFGQELLARAKNNNRSYSPLHSINNALDAYAYFFWCADPLTDDSASKPSQIADALDRLQRKQHYGLETILKKFLIVLSHVCACYMTTIEIEEASNSRLTLDNVFEIIESVQQAVSCLESKDATRAKPEHAFDALLHFSLPKDHHQCDTSTVLGAMERFAHAESSLSIAVTFSIYYTFGLNVFEKIRTALGCAKACPERIGKVITERAQEQTLENPQATFFHLVARPSTRKNPVIAFMRTLADLRIGSLYDENVFGSYDHMYNDMSEDDELQERAGAYFEVSPESFDATADWELRTPKLIVPANKFGLDFLRVAKPENRCSPTSSSGFPRACPCAYSLEERDEENFNPFWLSLAHNRLDAVFLLLTIGADPNSPSPISIRAREKENPCASALHYYYEKRLKDDEGLYPLPPETHTLLIDAFINAGADLSVVDPQRGHFLQAVISNSNSSQDVILYTIRRVKQYICIRHDNDADEVSNVLKAMASAAQTSTHTPSFNLLMHFVSSHRLFFENGSSARILDFFVDEAGIDINAVSDCEAPQPHEAGQTCLYIACGSRSRASAGLIIGLLRKGADPNLCLGGVSPPESFVEKISQCLISSFIHPLHCFLAAHARGGHRSNATAVLDSFFAAGLDISNGFDSPRIRTSSSSSSSCSNFLSTLCEYLSCDSILKFLKSHCKSIDWSSVRANAGNRRHPLICILARNHNVATDSPEKIICAFDTIARHAKITRFFAIGDADTRYVSDRADLFSVALRHAHPKVCDHLAKIGCVSNTKSVALALLSRERESSVSDNTPKELINVILSGGYDPIELYSELAAHNRPMRSHVPEAFDCLRNELGETCVERERPSLGMKRSREIDA